ncbi:MAG: hypothetical protein II303_00155, partial [Alistipes sp.]|nr:hypothetical protein [Alistipes sp.]
MKALRLVLPLLLTLFVACGGDDKPIDEPQPEPTPEPTPAEPEPQPEPTPEPEPLKLAETPRNAEHKAALTAAAVLDAKDPAAALTEMVKSGQITQEAAEMLAAWGKIRTTTCTAPAFLMTAPRRTTIT